MYCIVFLFGFATGIAVWFYSDMKNNPYIRGYADGYEIGFHEYIRGYNNGYKRGFYDRKERKEE